MNERGFIEACYDGDLPYVTEYLRNDPKALHRFPLRMTVDIEQRAYNLADDHKMHNWFMLFVKHSKTAQEPAFYCVRNANTLRVLLDKAHVWLSINVICTYIINKRVDLLQVLADTPWLGFSRRTLMHLELLAEHHGIPHVFPEPAWRSGWGDEMNSAPCDWLHTPIKFRYSKANDTVVAVVWCMHQILGWADMAEPVIDRLPPAVILELDSEGPVLGIPGAPKGFPVPFPRLVFGAGGIIIMYLLASFILWPPRPMSWLDLFFLVFMAAVGLFCLVVAMVRPFQTRQKKKN